VRRHPPRRGRLEVDAAAAQLVAVALQLSHVLIHDAVNPDLGVRVGLALQGEPEELVGLEDEQLDGSRRHHSPRCVLPSTIARMVERVTPRRLVPEPAGPVALKGVLAVMDRLPPAHRWIVVVMATPLGALAGRQLGWW
jgi:hypothetical protein